MGALGLRATLPFLAIFLAPSGCTTPDSEPSPPAFSLESPKAGHFDYQLGTPYDPAADVGFLVRDRHQKPARGRYNICYINGFQTQPGEEDAPHWNDHYDLKLKDDSGEYVMDGKWNEFVLDTRTPRKRARLLEVISPWIAQCAADGFDAIEIDNMDSYLRTDLIQPDHNADLMRRIITVAKSLRLEVAQKNAIQIAEGLKADFAIVENCGQYDICGQYIDLFGSKTFVVEYNLDWFTETCARFGSQANIVWRDEKLKPRGHQAFAYQQCRQ